MTAESPIIQVDGLVKRFAAFTAVDRLSFSVNRGEIFGLVGPDGAGKTATMRMLAGVMRPDGGAIVIDGVDAVADPEGIKPHVSYMPQRFGLYEDLTVDENIRFYADLFEVPPALRRERASRLLAASGMSNFGKFRAGQLSGGMKQKLGVACALVHTPKILLLDEPTTGVDPVSRRDFWRILYGLREDGVTIVISTAYLDEAERCNRLTLLHSGRALYCDTPTELKKRMPGALIAISSMDGRAVRSAITGKPGVSQVLLVGDGVHAVVDNSDLRIPQLREAIGLAGVQVSGIAVAVPSIEDVFVALLETGQAQ
ncbi:ABC transporter ATP-binding protein [Bradyrhizobium sp. dw_78]|uniref:ABC transporter ATP-binding protein n=1 Tax=Bradyrhizobium sp. dw_78 TaxID=2719793 RepID=UPI001BD43B28|nr:ABC transporter ATP-binding protein [Bradyrhizobium sp. dw_78]